MKKIILFSILGMLLFLNFNSKAQFESIDLKTYKLTNYRFKALGTRLNTRNDGSFWDSKSTNWDYTYKSKSNQNHISGGGDLNFSSTIYSRKYSGYHGVSFGFYTGYNEGSRDNKVQSPWSVSESSEKTSSNISVFQLNGFSENRFYMKSDFFWGVNLKTNQYTTYSYSKSKDDTDEIRQIASSCESRNSIGLQLGKGRIENTTDARLAIYILDDLLKKGRLSHTPSEDEVFAFADFITKTLNKRVTDYRIKRINEYVAIDSFLVSNGLANKTDGLYFGLIDDNWNYARAQTWSTGSELYFEVVPILNYFNRFDKLTQLSVTKTRSELMEYGLGINAGYRSAWISGLKWQQGYSVNGSFNIFKYDTVGNYYSRHNYKNLTGNANYYVSYIPNTRTVISGGVNISAIKYLSDDYNNRLAVYSGFSGNCNYYFSEKLNLSVSTSVNYSLDKHDTPYAANRIGFILGAALQYYIF